MTPPPLQRRIALTALAAAAIGAASLATYNRADGNPSPAAPASPAAPSNAPPSPVNWSALAPQCEIASPHPALQVGAIDRARPGHVVVAAGGADMALADAKRNLSGCMAVLDYSPGRIASYGLCGVSTIATADNAPLDSAVRLDHDVGALHPLIVGARPGSERDAAIATWATQDRWRFATIAHLPTGAQCSIGQAGEHGTAANAPPWACQRSAQICHGRKPGDFGSTTSGEPPDSAAWCPNPDACACKSSDLCHYPQIRSLEIDPRNGFAYAVTSAMLSTGSGEFGLLTSPDGGRHWMRMGNASGDPLENDSALPPAIAAGSRGAQVLTHQFEPSPPNGARLDDANALDLTRHPLQVTSMGRIGMAWTPCATAQYSGNGVLALDYHKDPRPRGTLVATLPVEWQSSTGHRVSSVFVAIERDDCQGERPLPGPLVFRDTGR